MDPAEQVFRALDTSPEGASRFPVCESRAISDIKVDVGVATWGSQKAVSVHVEWTDAVNQRQAQQFYGLTAKQLATDLHAATLCGEIARRCFLTGLIRGLYIERRV